MKTMNKLLGTPFLLSEPVFDELASIKPEALEAIRAQRMDRTWTVKRRGDVAVMSIHGAIARRDSFLLWLRGGTALEDAAPDLKTALEDPNIKAIVLDIDSPGGEVSGISEFAEMVRASKKPVVAYVGNQAASAALWIASAADKIVVNQTAELGSLGVVFGYRKEKSQMVEIVSTVSPKKRLDPTSEAGLAEIQQRADDQAVVFVEQVARYRKKTIEQVKSDFGQGGMMIASKAIKAGMADKLGSLEGVIASLQTKDNNLLYGGTAMGLTTDLRALVAGKEDADIESALASIGFIPKTQQDYNSIDAEELEKIKTEAMAAGEAKGKTEAVTAETTRVAQVMEKCQLAKVTSPAFMAEIITMAPDEAGKKIIDAQADAALATTVFSTVNPLSAGGENPLVSDAKKRAEAR